MAELDVWAAIRGLKQQLDRLTSFEWPLYVQGTWTPTWTGLVVVGAPSYTGRYTRIGRMVLLYAYISAGGANTTASTMGTTHINNLPFTNGFTIMPNLSAVSAVSGVDLGRGFIANALPRGYTPSWVATNDDIAISGWYEI